MVIEKKRRSVYSTCDSQYTAAINHGSPRPRNTLTPFDPVTLPIASSADLEFFAAIIDANVSGNDVPSATNEIAVILSFNPTMQPNIAATSPIMAASKPMNASETKNVNHRHGDKRAAQSVDGFLVEDAANDFNPINFIAMNCRGDKQAGARFLASNNLHRHIELRMCVKAGYSDIKGSALSRFDLFSTDYDLIHIAALCTHTDDDPSTLQYYGEAFPTLALSTFKPVSHSLLPIA